jgi:hypothetical protein
MHEIVRKGIGEGKARNPKDLGEAINAIVR